LAQCQEEHETEKPWKPENLGSKTWGQVFEFDSGSFKQTWGQVFDFDSGSFKNKDLTPAVLVALLVAFTRV